MQKECKNIYLHLKATTLMGLKKEVWAKKWKFSFLFFTFQLLNKFLHTQTYVHCNPFRLN